MAHIAIIADCIEDSSPGIRNYASNLLLELFHQDAKNQYTVIHYSNKDPFWKTLDSFSNVKQAMRPTRQNFVSRGWRKLFGLQRWLKKKNFDLVHELGQVGPFFTKWPRKTKTVLTIHDLTPIHHPQFHPFLSWFSQKLFLKRIIRNTDHVIAVSESTKKDLQAYCPSQKNITVIPEAASPVFRKLKNSPSGQYPKRFLLSVGTLEPRKNVETAIRVFQKIKLDFPGLKLLLVGRNGWKNKALIHTMDEDPDIIHMGYVSEQELVILYNLTDCFLFLPWYEGFGLPVVEAMQCGARILTSNRSSMPEIVQNSDYMADPANETEIIQKLKKILATKVSPDYSQLKTFSWEFAAKKTLDLYQQ